MKKLFVTISLSIILITFFNTNVNSQCSEDYIYKKITETAKKDSLILIRNFIYNKENPELNSWTVSLKNNTNYKIYFFTKNEKDELFLYKITKKEKIVINTIFAQKDKNYIEILNDKSGVYQIQIKTNNENNCIFGALYFENNIE